MSDLTSEFGAIDIYLFDQLLRGHVRPGDRVVDAGCGFGRNLVYLLRAGYDVRAFDPDPSAVAEVRALAARVAPNVESDRFRVESAESNSFADGSADVVISSAVLHFAPDEPGFDDMLAGSWRLLAPGGLFFCRLASTIGIESRVVPIGLPGRRRHRLPDGSERFLVDETLLLDRTRRLGGRLVDPLKTTVVQDRRAMTTWVVRRDR